MCVKECSTIRELMDCWSNKEPQHIKYVAQQLPKDGYISYEEFKGKRGARKFWIVEQINHQKDHFIADGIVCDDVWKQLKTKRIMFLLKEAYADEKDWDTFDDLTEYLRTPDAAKANMWKRAAEWVYALNETDQHTIPDYEELPAEHIAELLHSIAVVNLKKSKGKSNSIASKVSAYANQDKEEILREIELIDPDIIICGYTFDDLLTITEKTALKHPGNDAGYYETVIAGDRPRLYIDFYHPANHFPKLMNFYSIACVYQQYLKDKQRGQCQPDCTSMS